jgi:hypothetical protein
LWISLFSKYDSLEGKGTVQYERLLPVEDENDIDAAEELERWNVLGSLTEEEG